MSTKPTERIIEKFKRDRFATYIGIEILEASPGHARTKLEIREHHYNAVDIVQGGVLFTLADFALAVAGNCDEDEKETTVSIEASISFFKPGRAGTIFAEAREISRSRRLVSYDIPVTNESGELLARFYGRVFVRDNR